MKTALVSRLLFTFAAALTIASVASAKIIREQNETIDLNGIKSVEVNLSAGNIDLSGSERSDMQFDLQTIFKTNSEKEADQAQEKVVRIIERRGDRLYIEVKNEADDSFWKSIFSDSVNFHFQANLSLPSGIEVKVHTNGGNIEIRKIASKIDAHTNGGNIHIAESRGEVKAQTNGGNIDVADAQGIAKLHTNGGNIRVVAHDATITAHTNGGNIDATFRGGIVNDSKLKTNGGRVTANLPENCGFQLSAKANGGQVRLNYNGIVKGEVKKNEVNAAINGGGPLLTLGTHGGQVVVNNL